MGGVLLEKEVSPQTEESETPIGTFFMEQCPYFLSLGMTWEEYWHGDNALPRVFLRKAEIERDRENLSQWRLGQYMMSAIAAALSEKNKYPEEPFPMTDDQAREQKERSYRRKAEQFKIGLISEQRVSDKRAGE